MSDSISLDWVKAAEGRPDVLAIAQAFRGVVETELNCPSSTFDAAAQKGTFVEAVYQGLQLIAEAPNPDNHSGRADNAALARQGLSLMRERAMRPV